MRPWFLLFVLSIGGGGGFALLVALARTPIVSEFIPPRFFYHWLIGHVDLALIMGFLSFLIALWHKVFGEKERFFEIALAFGGAILLFLSALLGVGGAVHNNYVPTIDHPLFFLSVALFGSGYALVTLRLLPKAFKLIVSDSPLERMVSVSVLLSALFLITMMVSLIRTEGTEESYLYFERLYWLPGHIHQFINASLLIISWTLLSLSAGFKIPKMAGWIPFFLLPFPILYFFMQTFTPDPIGDGVKAVTTLGYALGIGVPTILFALYLLLKLPTRGHFYLWGLKLSVLIYMLGASMGYLIAGSDLRIPAHYHGVIASILLSLMMLTYHFLKELKFINRIPTIVRLQPVLYGTGMLLFVSALFWAGVYGAPRKTYGTGYIESLKVYLFMGAMGVGSVLSVMGGIIFVLFVLYSIIRKNEFGIQKEAQQED